MSATPSSYSITMRLHTAPDHGVVGAVATAIASAGGIVTAIDVADSSHDRLVVDVTCSAADADHAEELGRARSTPGRGRRGPQGQRPHLPAPHRRQDRGHLQGPAAHPRRPVDGLHARASAGSAWRSPRTPRTCRRLTIKGNSVAVVTDGSAVLGLGNIGPGAALPVMEGKAALFKRFADIDAWPICLATQDTDEIVRAVEMIAPGFGGINLEDIAAPRCFEVERRLRESLDIPVFHDDQHGTAIVVLAALTNALRCVDKKLPTCRIVVSGAGAAGSAIVTLLLAGGRGRRRGLRQRRHPLRRRRDAQPGHGRARRPHQPAAACAATCTTRCAAPTCSSGSARPGILPAEWIADMAERGRRVRAGQPRPGGRPGRGREVRRGRGQRAAPTSPTRSTTCWRSPASSAGCSTRGRSEITIEMLLKAADAIAHVVKDDELNPNFIIPSVFNPDVPKAVAAAIRGADA